MGMIRFTPVAELTDPLTLSIGLSGGSGTGKTYSALLMARGIAEVVTGRAGAPIGYVDTENRRALHYKQAFPEMMHFDMKAVDDSGNMVGFGPERWIQVIDAAEAAKLPVLVIDSFSHAWEGVGGVLDLHAQTLDRLTGGDDNKKNQRSQLAWAAVKPRYRRLIDRIVRAKCNIIICTRAKPVMQEKSAKTNWQEVNARQTKTRRQDVPWDPAADGDLMFEMTTMVILDPSAPGCPIHQIKVADQFKGLLDARQPMGVETGRAMAKWAMGQGDAQKQKDILDAARAEARKGREAFVAYWNSDTGKANRQLLNTIKGECQEIVARAEQEAAQSDDDPFATPAPILTDAERERIAREVAEEARAAEEGAA
ncbi:AAA family ATPase [Roseinatronobacter alkalisoli]|uniref:AAA family ATPase n=1 Tax=Roseinatronobacter alkalisoli TaxID=3028235 RepID=A0ABT5TBZ9_9RHOB|nr:AAA family ATPase [Roseinatronobacter sp. HJB301]MDD7972484.1 AAA family ATPase [Roseinatronobacter sp. HJB301]